MEQVECHDDGNGRLCFNLDIDHPLYCTSLQSDECKKLDITAGVNDK